jgi:hypothetical protein
MKDTHTRFQRVQSNKVHFAKDELKSNNFFDKPNAKGSYGEMHQISLSKSKGKKFKSEKNKKKKSISRGGKIDMSIRSIKFDG